MFSSHGNRLVSLMAYCLSKHPHESKSESVYCDVMLARKLNGEIPDFVWQFSIPLTLEDGKTWKNWKADFAVPAKGFYPAHSLTILRGQYNVSEVHESKGWNRSDDNFRLKLNICMRNHPELPVFVNHRRMKFTPKGLIIIRPRRKKVWPKRLLGSINTITESSAISKKVWNSLSKKFRPKRYFR